MGGVFIFFVKKEKRIFIFALTLLLVGIFALCIKKYEEPPNAKAVVAEETFPSVPIIMYHSVCNNKKVVSDYRIAPELFEKDVEYLYKNGYKSIFVSDIVAYVYDGIPLPEKPIILTLDDGYLNNLTNVLPILEKYNMCATVSVVGEFSETFSNTVDTNSLYAYLTWDDIRTLVNSGRVEIGNHTFSMHEIGERRGCAKISSESIEKYEEVLTNDLEKLQKTLVENSGVFPIVFTYPFGFVSKESLPTIKKLGFLAALTCYEHINYINGTTEQLYSLGRFNRPPGMSTEAFMKKIGV